MRRLLAARGWMVVTIALLALAAALPAAVSAASPPIKFTVRYGANENLVGIEAIRAFRKARSPAGLARALRNTVITTYGRDFAVASTLFHRGSLVGKVGRQMQSWVRFADGWKVVAAHVSIIDAPKA